MFMEVLVVELVCMWDLNTLGCLYCQHGTSCAWVKGLMKDVVTSYKYHLHMLVIHCTTHIMLGSKMLMQST